MNIALYDVSEGRCCLNSFPVLQGHVFQSIVRAVPQLAVGPAVLSGMNNPFPENDAFQQEAAGFKVMRTRDTVLEL